jgi:hypothetical protein
LEDRAAAVVGVIFDDAGEALPASPMDLARQFGCVTGDIDIINYVVRKLGFVHVAPLRDALLVKFEPATVRHLAVFAAFYEIAAHAPKRLILGCPGKVGSPDQYEIFNNPIEGLKRVEAALQRSQTSIAPAEEWSTGSPVESRPCERPQEPYLKTKRVAGLSGPSEPAAKVPAGDRSKRLSRPLYSMSPEDEWLGQVLGHWRDARSGWRLPSSESLDPLRLLNIARGRAHIVDTSQSDPEGYRFRLWGSINSYGGGYENMTLGDMPAGLMRDNAIEDYREVVTTGVPTYQLISHVERKLPYSYARLLLPLAADGRRVDRLVVLINERLLPELQVS